MASLDDVDDVDLDVLYMREEEEAHEVPAIELTFGGHTYHTAQWSSVVSEQSTAFPGLNPETFTELVS